MTQRAPTGTGGRADSPVPDTAVAGRAAARSDRNRTAAYSAEDQFCALLDRGGRVDFHGSMLDLPPERRFGDVAGVQRYLDRVRELPWGHAGTPRPIVRTRKGAAKAHWQAPDTIAVPASRWALREVVVLHEYAHHVNHHVHRGSGHDRRFCQAHVDLVSGALGPSSGVLLLAAYHEAGCYA